MSRADPGGLAAAAPGSYVAGRRSRVDDAPLCPGLGQLVDVLAERRVARAPGQDLEGPLDVLARAAGGRTPASFSNAAARSGSYLSA